MTLQKRENILATTPLKHVQAQEKAQSKHDLTMSSATTWKTKNPNDAPKSMPKQL